MRRNALLMKQALWILLLAANSAFARNSIPTLTAEQWRHDLGDLVNVITTRHRDPYHFTSKAEFDLAVSDLHEQIPSMKNYQVVVGFQHLAALIGDGHTFLDTSGLYERFPLEVFWFGSDLRVIRAAPEYRQALGTRIIAIGSLPIREVQSRLQQLIPQGENPWYVLSNSAQWQLTAVEPLAALGVIPKVGPSDFTLEEDSGQRFKLRIRPIPAGTSDSGEIARSPVPLPFQHPQDPFWFRYLPDSKTVYADWRSYQDLEATSARLFEFIGTHPVNRLIIDMRWNAGGNFAKGREYLIYKIMFMPKLNRAGHLFVITGRGTFSAAMTNVTDFRRETEAILVGEPTGARPNNFMENYLVKLPNSKLRLSCAMHMYRFQPNSHADAVFPDKRIDPDWELFREGQDAALRWILAQPLEAPAL
jgi:hypothetical protein